MSWNQKILLGKEVEEDVVVDVSVEIGEVVLWRENIYHTGECTQEQ